MKYLFHNFINTLRHYKASSLLNIFGMAVAFAAFYVILTQVQWGFTYNRDIKDGDRIYVMAKPSFGGGRDLITSFCRPMAEQVLAECSEVESYGTATFYADVDPLTYYLKEDDNVRKVKSIMQNVTSGAVSVFDFEAEQGSFDDFNRANALAVSSKFAEANNLKVGDFLSASQTGDPALGKIVAIWKDKYPENTGPGSIEMISNMGDRSMDSWSETSFTYFVKLRSTDDVAAFEQKASAIVRRMLEDQYNLDQEDLEEIAAYFKISLLPYGDLYYNSTIENKMGISRSGSRITDVSLLIVAALIIIIALVNFINFSFALVPARVRSVNTYKIFGTSRKALVYNFILESVGLDMLALILAALLIVIFQNSSAAELLNAPVDIVSNTTVLMLTIAVALVGAIAASIPPALYITSFQPAVVLKGAFGMSRAGQRLRNLLIGVQFTVSMALIICAVFMRLQHDYMLDFEMGFNKQCLISGLIPGEVCWWKDRNEAFEDKLRNNPDIVDVTWAQGQIVNVNRMGWGREYKGEGIEFQCYPVAYNFLDFMGIDIVQGRNFSKADELSDDGVIIFNEEARGKFNITLDSSGPSHHSKGSEIAGICKDFHFRPLQYGKDPFAFYIFGRDHSWMPQGLSHIYVRTAEGANPNVVMEFISKTVLEVTPDVDPETIYLHTFDEELARKYKSEDKLSKQITAFTLVAFILALMGVFGLVFFETQHRMKEIAVRRVLGAEVKDILSMLSRKYATIVMICFVIAAPFSYLVTERYFSNFAYHMSIQPWVFVAALVVVLVVTVALVVARSFSAATKNPVESIKAE